MILLSVSREHLRLVAVAGHACPGFARSTDNCPANRAFANVVGDACLPGRRLIKRPFKPAFAFISESRLECLRVMVPGVESCSSFCRRVKSRVNLIGPVGQDPDRQSNLTVLRTSSVLFKTSKHNSSCRFKTCPSTPLDYMFQTSSIFDERCQSKSASMKSAWLNSQRKSSAACVMYCEKFPL